MEQLRTGGDYRRRLGLTVNQETILHEGAPTPEVVVDLTEDEPMHAEAPNRNGIIQIEQMEEASSHGYQLRDRKKLARPSNTAEPLFDSSRPNKQQRTYGRVGGRQVVELARTRLFGTMKPDDQEEPHVEGEEEALRREIDVCVAGVRCEP